MARQDRAPRDGGARSSIYDDITTRIIAELEAGRLPWVQPWGTASAKAPLALPRNAATQRQYSGINILILWGAVVQQGYPTQASPTFRQALALGGNVRKGERGTTVVYADRFTPEDEKRRARETGDTPGQIPFLKRFHVLIWFGCTPYFFDSSASVISSRIASSATFALNSGVCVFLFVISDRLSRHAIHLNNWSEFLRPPLPLRALADQTETLERDARQIDGFRRDVEAVHSRRMGDDHLDHADVDPESDRTGALLRAHLAVVDELLPVEVPDLLLAQIALERLERGGLAATRRFAYLAHIDYVEIDEIAEGGQAGDGRLVRRQPLIHPGLRLGRAQRWASSRRRNVSLA